MVERANRVALVAGLGLMGLIGAARAAEIDTRARTASEERMRHDIRLLSSDEFEGRGVTTHGINKAAGFIAQQFEKAGLKAGGKGQLLPAFIMPGGTLVDRRASAYRPEGQVLNLKPGTQFNVFGMSHPGDVSGPIVFAGYGITTPEYDDYKGLDVEGKIVVVLRDTPRAENRFLPFAGQAKREHGSFTKKMQLALKNKAAGILFVNDRDAAADGDDLLHFSYLAHAPSPSKLPAPTFAAAYRHDAEIHPRRPSPM